MFAIKEWSSCGARFGKTQKPGEIELMVIGEAPDRSASDAGGPFPNDKPLGMLLDEWLKVLCPNGKYMVTNVMKHYPMRNNGDWRTPTGRQTKEHHITYISTLKR